MINGKEKRTYILVLRSPRKRQLSSRSAQALSDLAQLLHLGDTRLTFGRRELVCTVLDEGDRRVLGVARVGGNRPGVVLSGEEGAGERGPDGGAVLVLLEERLYSV